MEHPNAWAPIVRSSSSSVASGTRLFGHLANCRTLGRFLRRSEHGARRFAIVELAVCPRDEPDDELGLGQQRLTAPVGLAKRPLDPTASFFCSKLCAPPTGLTWWA